MFSNSFRFSVLIPVYFKDDPQFFDQALHSIYTTQTTKPSQIVIVIDGPVGRPLQSIIDTWSVVDGVQVTIRQLPFNVGLGKALQIGLNDCLFDYVARMDSDDISHKDRFEDQLACFRRDPNLDICGSNIVEFVTGIENPASLKIVPEYTNDIVKYSYFRNPFNHPSVMFKRTRVYEIGGYQDMPFFEDYYLWIRCIMSDFSFYNIQKNLVFMRAGPGHLSRRSGINYAKFEFQFLSRIRKIGFLSFRRFIFLLLVRCSSRLIPLFLTRFIYSILRK